MKVISLKPLVISGYEYWDACINETEIDDEIFSSLNHPNMIPANEIWEQEPTDLSNWCGREVERVRPTINGDNIAYKDSSHKYILIRATRYHVFLRVESITEKEDIKNVLLDSRYAVPEDWKIVS